MTDGLDAEWQPMAVKRGPTRGTESKASATTPSWGDGTPPRGLPDRAMVRRQPWRRVGRTGRGSARGGDPAREHAQPPRPTHPHPTHLRKHGVRKVGEEGLGAAVGDRRDDDAQAVPPPPTIKHARVLGGGGGGGEHGQPLPRAHNHAPRLPSRASTARQRRASSGLRADVSTATRATADGQEPRREAMARARRRAGSHTMALGEERDGEGGDRNKKKK